MTSKSNNRTKFNVLDVVLVPFPFSDLSNNKKRPCLILSLSRPKGLNDHSVVAMITSNMTGLTFPNDLKINDLQEAGLPKASILRLDKLVTIEQTLILKKLGTLSGKDKKGVERGLRSLFKEVL